MSLSTRPSPRARIKDRVRRIKSELSCVEGALFWATKGREIENYIPGEVIQTAIGLTHIPDPDQYSHFFPRKGEREKSFIEAKLGRKTLDKTQFAVSCSPHMNLENMQNRFDWSVMMEEIVKTIERWNT